MNTVVKLLLEVGPACAQYQAENLRALDSMVVQVDEIWSFVGCKQKRVRTCTIDTDHLGDIWTWTALDADSKLMITWFVGDRSDPQFKMIQCLDMTLRELDVAIAKVENIMGSLGVPIHPRDTNENAEALLFKLYQLATGVNTLSQYASMIQEAI